MPAAFTLTLAGPATFAGPVAFPGPAAVAGHLALAGPPVLAVAALPLAGVAGALLGTVLRGQIFRYAVPPAQPWRQQCPHCRDTIVAAGWRGLLTALPPTGRCPRCRRRVGPRTGLVEAVTAGVFFLLAWRAGSTLAYPALCWVAALSVVLAFTDVAVRRLPDPLTLPAFGGTVALLAAAAVLSGRLDRLATALACALLAAAGYLAAALLAPAGLGVGDGKAMLSAGAVTGWYGWAVTLSGVATGLVLAGGWAAVLLALRRVRGRDHLAHGPFLLLGALVAVLVGGS